MITTEYHIEACNNADLCSIKTSTPVHVVNLPPAAGYARLVPTVELTSINETQPSVGFAKYTHNALNGSWGNFATYSTGLLEYDICVGTSPKGCQILGPVPAEASDFASGAWSTGEMKYPLRCGHAHFLTVRAHDCAGNTASAVSPALTVCCDAPTVRGVALTVNGAAEAAEYVKPADNLTLSWSTVAEECSGVRLVSISIVDAASQAVAAQWNIWHQLTPTRNVTDAFSDTATQIPAGMLTSLSKGMYSVQLTAVSHAGWVSKVSSAAFLLDTTQPSAGSIILGGTHGASTCYMRTATSLTVAWTGFADSESFLQSIEVGLGSSASAVDLVAFTNAGATSAGSVTLSLVNSTVETLAAGSFLWPVVRATNRAGLSVSAVAAKGFLVIDATSEPAICF